MTLFRISFLFLSLTLLAACGASPDLRFSTRNERPDLVSLQAFAVPLETGLTREAIALEEQVGRIAPAADQTLTSDVLAAQARMDAVEQATLAMLAEQQAELADLHAGHAAGQIPDAAYSARLTEMRQSRAAVADALALAARRSGRAGEALEKAQMTLHAQALQEIRARAMTLSEALARGAA